MFALSLATSARAPAARTPRPPAAATPTPLTKRIASATADIHPPQQAASSSPLATARVSAQRVLKAQHRAQTASAQSMPMAITSAAAFLIPSLKPFVDMEKRIKNALSDGNARALKELIVGVNLREFKDLWIVTSEHNNAKCLEILHQHIPDLIDEEDSKGRTALHHAIQNTSDKKVSILLRYGASKDKPIKLDETARKNLNFSLTEKITPLAYAKSINRTCGKNNYELYGPSLDVVTTLTQFKALQEPEATTSRMLESNSLMPLLFVGGLAVTMLLQEDDSVEDKVKKALRSGEIEIVEQLMSEGVNLREFKGLWVTAAKCYNPNSINFLAKHIPELINQEDKKGRTALHISIVQASLNHVRFLLMHGASKRNPINLSLELRKFHGFSETEVITTGRYASTLTREYYENGTYEQYLRMDEIFNLLCS